MPIARFQMSDGRVGRFEVPEGTTPENAQAIIEQYLNGSASKSSEPSGIQGMIASIGKADPYNLSQIGKESADAMMNSPSLQSAAIRLGGQGATVAAAPIAAGLSKAFTALPDSIQSAAKGAANYISDSAVGDVARQYSAALSPETKAMANLAATAAGGNVATSAAEGGVTAAGKGLEKAGNALEQSGKASFDATRSKYISDLYAPKITPTVAKERAGQTMTKGWNQTPQYVPSAYEQAAIDTLSQLPVKSSNTLQTNLNIVDKAVGDEASALRGNLEKLKVSYKPDYFTGKLDTALDDLKKDPLIVGDGETVASRIFDKMKEIAASNPNTPAGLLKTRQDFDAWARSKKGSVFDANDTAFSTAVKAARNLANDTIAEIAPSADVKASLLKQSQLLGASDNITSKIPSAPSTRLGMAGEKVSNLFPKTLSGKATEAGIAAGLGGLGFVTGTLPMMAGTGAAGLGLYGAKKAIQSPILRTLAGKAATATGQAMQYKKGLKP